MICKRCNHPMTLHRTNDKETVRAEFLCSNCGNFTDTVKIEKWDVFPESQRFDFLKTPVQ